MNGATGRVLSAIVRFVSGNNAGPSAQGSFPHCRSTDIVIKEKPPHVGLYCGSCDRWIKWLPQGRPIAVMPFGKHKGAAIKELPSNYLDWLLQNVELKGSLFKALSEEFERRGSEGAV